SLRSPPRSMIAILARSWSRPIRSPRFWKLAIAPEEARVSAFRWGREIGAAAAGDEPAAGVEHLRLRGRELAAEPDHLAARGQVARHGGRMIVDPQVDGWHAAAGPPHHCPIGGEIEPRR